MVQVTMDVGGGDIVLRVLARAEDIGRARELVSEVYPGVAVSVVFPIQPEEFFADADVDEGCEALTPLALTPLAISPFAVAS